MKIAFPVEENNGLQSPVYGHFGSAPWFVLTDVPGGELEVVTNEDAQHEHGMCRPDLALGGRAVDAVVVGGIGAGALRKLQAQGVRVFRGVEGSVQENLDLLNAGRLPEFQFEMTCAGHGHGEGGCPHHG
jgi:predicted Fe-Mo cluster-binding NifX family protein